MAVAATGGGVLLLVEDDDAIGRLVKSYLEQQDGWRVLWLRSGEDAIAELRRHPVRLVVLDIGLPGIDGFEVCRTMRAHSKVPIVMLTARDEEPDRVAGLELGADDYVVKPFSVPELIARMRAISRRAATTPEPSRSVLTFKDLRLDLGAYRAYKEEDELDLTNKEFELLRMLLMRPGTLVRRDEVVRAIWNMSLGESGKTLDVHMSGLRKKLGDDARKPVYIETVRSVGFRLATEPG